MEDTGRLITTGAGFLGGAFTLGLYLVSLATTSCITCSISFGSTTISSVLTASFTFLGFFGLTTGLGSGVDDADCFENKDLISGSSSITYDSLIISRMYLVYYYV